MYWTAPGFVEGYFNGVASGTPVAIVSAIVGNLGIAECAIFAANNSGGNSWAGDGAHAGIFYRQPTDLEFWQYHQGSGL
jgi:hypothetical protein